MAGYLIALEDRALGIKSGNVAEMPERLHGPLAGARWSASQVTDGPGRKPAWIFAVEPADRATGEPAQCAYVPDRQTWSRFAKSVGGPTDFWIGVDNLAKPRPVDLARVDGVAGWECRLADGNVWIIPAIKAGPWSAAPEQFTVEDDGTIRTAADPRYADLQAEAESWWEDCRLKRDIRGSRSTEWYRFACRLLALNYRVDERICSQKVLGLFRTETDQMLSVLWCAFGGPAAVAELFAQQQKKTPETAIPPDGIAAPAGGAGSTHPIGPIGST